MLLIQLTPAGRGAVATLRIEGRGASDLLARHFTARSARPLADVPPGRIVVGRFDPGGEEIVVCRQSDGAVELHCHGGLAAIARIEETLMAGGCRKISWQDWIAGREPDPFAAAARLALAEARTARTAAILLDQYRGALRQAVEAIESVARAGATDAAREQAVALLARAPVGLHLVHPWQVIVAGRPNVGKSSLLNAIAGYHRVIVHDRPGTTRDVVSIRTALDGWPVEISDTAGLRETGDPVEQAGVDLAQRRIAAADLVVLVFDRSEAWTEADQSLVESHPAAMLVENKCDLPPGAGCRPTAMEVSAATAAGVDALCREMADRLVPRPPPAGAAVPFTEDQIVRIRKCL